MDSTVQTLLRNFLNGDDNSNLGRLNVELVRAGQRPFMALKESNRITTTFAFKDSDVVDLQKREAPNFGTLTAEEAENFKELCNEQAYPEPLKKLQIRLQNKDIIAKYRLRFVGCFERGEVQEFIGKLHPEENQHMEQDWIPDKPVFLAFQEPPEEAEFLGVIVPGVLEKKPFAKKTAEDKKDKS